MRDLSRFLMNPFDDESVSLDELLAFATDCLQRFIAKNTGSQWNTRINATTTALQTVGNCSSNDNLKLGIRRAAKLAKDEFRRQLPDNIARLHSAVVAKFGPKSTQVLGCFPAGRTAFDISTDDALQSLLSPLVTSLVALSAQIGTQPGNDAGGLLSTWIALHAASEASTGTKTVSESEKRAARRNLNHQLFLNLLALAELLENQPELLGEYMQQTLLENATATVPPVPPPGP